jgi:hypothetical protein
MAHLENIPSNDHLTLCQLVGEEEENLKKSKGSREL